MIEVVQKAGVKRKPGWLYFLRGVDVWCIPMRKGKAKRVARGTFKREEGYLYYLDANGDVARVQRGIKPVRVMKMIRDGAAKAAKQMERKPRRKHSRSGQVKCPICSPCRCSLA